MVPDEKEEISSLKGVGPYTSGAVLSIAYNKPEPAVDGNVMRVLSRFFLIGDDITRPATRVKMEYLAKALIPEGRAGDFNQALMELGALVCTPRSPQCLTCPVMEHCEARLTGSEESLPVKKKAKPPRPERRLVGLIVGRGTCGQNPYPAAAAGRTACPHVGAPHVALPLPAGAALRRQWRSGGRRRSRRRCCTGNSRTGRRSPSARLSGSRIRTIHSATSSGT
nr:hypothetical protein [Paenibacillus larvae]